MKRFLVSLPILAISASLAMATVTPNSPVTPQTPNRGIVQFLQGTDVAGTYKTLYTAGSNGSKCWGLVGTSNDTSAAHLVTIQLVSSAVKYGGTAVNVPINSGFASAIPPVAFMTSANWPGLALDSDGNYYIMLISGDTLQATFATALTSSDLVNLQITCADY